MPDVETITLRSVSQTFRLPTVLRLKKYVNVPRGNVVWGKRAVLKRDNFTCIYCGEHVGSNATVDHIKPKSRGGLDTWTNTACACYKCNQRKGNRTPRESGMKLLWEPKIPRGDVLVLSGSIPEDWKLYIPM